MDILLSDIEARLPDRADPLFRIRALEIPAGSRVLVHGPSGRGKTTLLNLISGQFLPDAGSVRVGGTELTALDEAARARFRRDAFGIVFQRWNLIDHLTVAENVELALPPKASGRANRVREALREAGLEALAGRRGGLLSPGEQQRVAVARVRAASPHVLLADEPTSSLDNAGAERVLDALWEASRDRTLLVVSHDPRARARFADVRDFAEITAP